MQPWDVSILRFERLYGVYPRGINVEEERTWYSEPARRKPTLATENLLETTLMGSELPLSVLSGW